MHPCVVIGSHWWSSFERYRGISAKALKEPVAAIETPRSWPRPLPAQTAVARLDDVVRHAADLGRLGRLDVGEDGFKKRPVGVEPYRFVSFNPGVELVLEAFALIKWALSQASLVTPAFYGKEKSCDGLVLTRHDMMPRLLRSRRA
jgi:hypothetical protein